MKLIDLKRIVPSFFSAEDKKKDKRMSVLNRPQGTFLVIDRQTPGVIPNVPVYWFNPIINELDYVGQQNSYEYAKDIVKNDFAFGDDWLNSSKFMARTNACAVMDVTMDDEIHNVLTNVACTLTSFGSKLTPSEKALCIDMAKQVDALEVKSGHMKDDIAPVLKWIAVLLRH